MTWLDMMRDILVEYDTRYPLRFVDMYGMPVDIMHGMPVDISDILKQGQRYVEIGEGYPQTTPKIPKDGRDVCFGYHWQVRLEIS